jgi:DNA-binding CsgD family transcriptional regulator
VRALVDRDPQGLAAASAVFESMGAELLAAESAADAAVMWRRAGEPRKAAALERRARDLAERCEFPVTPALQALGARAQLTPSERRVALMAGAGRQNREIAHHLGVSLRTVENHLQRTYEKLGILGRGELQAALGQEIAALPDRPAREVLSR